MTRVFIAALFLTLTATVQAEPSGHWFNDGMAWYQHPCGLRAYAKYGSDTSAEVRRKYDITRRNPARCAELFP